MLCVCRSFIIHGEVYELGDFASVKKANERNNKICRIMTMYESNETWHANAKNRAIVRWYTFARNLEPKCNPQRIDFDRDNEVGVFC